MKTQPKKSTRLAPANHDKALRKALASIQAQSKALGRGRSAATRVARSVLIEAASTIEFALGSHLAKA